MKEIIIKDSNKERIEQAIKEAEGRAKERTVTYRDIVDAVDTLNKKFGFATKKSMEGLAVIVDMNAQRYPKAYKYAPQSTQFSIYFSKGSWRLYHVSRKDQSKTRTDRFDVYNLSAELKEEILKRYTSF